MWLRAEDAIQSVGVQATFPLQPCDAVDAQDLRDVFGPESWIRAAERLEVDTFNGLQDLCEFGMVGADGREDALEHFGAETADTMER